MGRNPKDPTVDILIPARKVVKFRSGKEMKNQLESSPIETENPPAAGYSPE
ncbi:MAG: HU family DNA-binding protein [Verrucomicrobiota bacterium]|nr:HU family DNA-binding protein [Verrucomicrobiota bacterium]